MHGQKIIHVKCHQCGAYMPDLEDYHGWNISECPCGNWYNVPDGISKGGGKLVG